MIYPKYKGKKKIIVTIFEGRIVQLEIRKICEQMKERRLSYKY